MVWSPIGGMDEKVDEFKGKLHPKPTFLSCRGTGANTQAVNHLFANASRQNCSACRRMKRKSLLTRASNLSAETPRLSDAQKAKNCTKVD